MNLPPPRAVLFDLGDTLLTLQYDLPTGFRRLCQLARNADHRTEEEVVAWATQLFAEMDQKARETQVEFTARAFAQRLFAQFNLAVDMPEVEVELEFWRSCHFMPPEPGIMDVLDLLKLRGVRTGIVSNSCFSAGVLGWELARQGMDGRFEFILSSADHGRRKPHPAIYQAAAGRLGLEPGDIWFVGDKVEFDIAGALNAGMTAIWYNPKKLPREGPEPSAEVSCWQDFQRLLTLP